MVLTEYSIFPWKLHRSDIRDDMDTCWVVLRSTQNSSILRDNQRTVSGYSFYDRELLIACNRPKIVCNNTKARVMHIFHEAGHLPWCARESFAALLASVSISSVLDKATLFFTTSLPPLISFSPSRTISGRKRSENRKALFSFASRRTKRRHDSPSLRNLTNFRSTSTSTSFSREAAAMQNEKRQTRQRTFSSLLLNLLIEDVIVTVLQLRLPSFATLQFEEVKFKIEYKSSKVKCVIDHLMDTFYKDCCALEFLRYHLQFLLLN